MVNWAVLDPGSMTPDLSPQPACNVVLKGGRLGMQEDDPLLPASYTTVDQDTVITHSVHILWHGSDGGTLSLTQSTISQLPNLCMKISILMHRRMWVRSFSTRLTSVTFAEDKVLIFLILRKNAKIV